MMVSIFLRVVAYALDAVIIGMLIGLASFSLCILGILIMHTRHRHFRCHLGNYGSGSVQYTIRLSFDFNRRFRLGYVRYALDEYGGKKLDGWIARIHSGRDSNHFFLRINRLNRLVNFSDRFFSDSRGCLHDLFSGIVIINCVDYGLNADL